MFEHSPYVHFSYAQVWEHIEAESAAGRVIDNLQLIKIVEMVKGAFSTTTSVSSAMTMPCDLYS